MDSGRNTMIEQIGIAVAQSVFSTLLSELFSKPAPAPDFQAVQKQIEELLQLLTKDFVNTVEKIVNQGFLRNDLDEAYSHIQASIDAYKLALNIDSMDELDKAKKSVDNANRILFHKVKQKVINRKDLEVFDKYAYLIRLLAAHRALVYNTFALAKNEPGYNENTQALLGEYKALFGEIKSVVNEHQTYLQVKNQKKIMLQMVLKFANIVGSDTEIVKSEGSSNSQKSIKYTFSLSSKIGTGFFSMSQQKTEVVKNFAAFLQHYHKGVSQYPGGLAMGGVHMSASLCFSDQPNIQFPLGRMCTNYESEMRKIGYQKGEKLSKRVVEKCMQAFFQLSGENADYHIKNEQLYYAFGPLVKVTMVDMENATPTQRHKVEKIKQRYKQQHHNLPSGKYAFIIENDPRSAQLIQVGVEYAKAYEYFQKHKKIKEIGDKVLSTISSVSQTWQHVIDAELDQAANNIALVAHN